MPGILGRGRDGRMPFFYSLPQASYKKQREALFVTAPGGKDIKNGPNLMFGPFRSTAYSRLFSCVSGWTSSIPMDSPHWKRVFSSMERESSTLSR